MYRTVYGKTALILSLIFAAIALFNIAWTLLTTRIYIDQANQRLNRDLARYLVQSEFSDPDTVIDGGALKKSFDMLMSINPNIELYLLDTEGKVLAYSAPAGRTISERISMEPVRRYLESEVGLPIRGPDPRNPGSRKVFSVAPIPPAGPAEGYLYVILSGEEHDSVLKLLETSYITRLSLWVWISTLVFLFVTALVLFHHLTRRHRSLAAAMESFRRSGFRQPVAVKDPGVGSGGDEVDRLTGIFSEMSSRIMEQFRDLEQADRIRRELLINVSHDLKMPLAAFHGHVETVLLKGEQLPSEERDRRLELALKHAERLGRLISELLELAKLDSPALKLELASFNPAELVQDVVQDFRTEAQARGIDLTVSQEGEIPPVSADIALVERVVQNLVSNAIRYTGEGGRVDVSVARAGHRVRVRVADSGIGISAEEMPHIFERFYRGQAARDLAADGTGLGLAIADRIVRLHGEEIQVASDPGAGATFTLHLPVGPPEVLEEQP